jgi:hypothetical protein
MNWLIERDEKGEPLRMVWMGPGDATITAKPEIVRAFVVNRLPMRSMQNWAFDHGLFESEREALRQMR